MAATNTVAAPASMYRDACAAFEAGALQTSREMAEDTLRMLSGQEGSVSDEHVSSHDEDVLFANTLLLLASIYSAVNSFSEAERLLATCAGYVQDHLGSTHVGCATIALLRGTLCVKAYRLCTKDPSSLVAADHFFQLAEASLCDVLSVQRLLLADVWHSRGVVCLLRDGFLDALEYFRKSLEIRTRYGDEAGVTELKIALTMEHIAHVYRWIPGKRLDAYRLLGLVAQTRRQHLGSGDPLYGEALFARGVLAKELGMQRKAEMLLKSALGVARKIGPAGEAQARHIRYWLHDAC